MKFSSYNLSKVLDFQTWWFVYLFVCRYKYVYYMDF